MWTQYAGKQINIHMIESKSNENIETGLYAKVDNKRCF